MALWNGGSAKGPGKRGGAPRKTQKGRKSWAFIFWAAFTLVIFGLFLLNKDSISQTLEKTQFMERVLNRQVTDTGVKPVAPLVPPALPAPVPAPAAPAPVAPATETVPADQTAKPGENKTVPPETPAKPGPAEQAKPSSGKEPAESARPAAAKPAAQDAGPAKPPAETPALRDRTLYFTRVDGDGVILREKTVRKFPASDTPMVDALRALISGPVQAEKNKGLLSLIPEKTKILQATVRGSTAYISFSEDFQFNVYGVEGYAASLRQIVWTVTEFPNVADVQILIEGRRVDYLGEGIWIGSPVSREML
jgi:spore germination protein GerM